MKKIISVLICLMLVIVTAFPAFAEEISDYKITVISGNDISSNLIYNHSFEFDNSEAFWKFKNLTHTIDNKTPLNASNAHYEALTINEKGTASALGYNENEKKQKAQIAFTEGEKYDFSCFVKNVDFNGIVYVYLNSKSNKHIVTEVDISNSNIHWKEVSCELESLATEAGSLTLEFSGSGTLLLDFVQLIPHSAHGYGEEQYKAATIRSDFYDAIGDNDFIGVEYQKPDEWKSTIVPAPERSTKDGIGLNEYFSLSSDKSASLTPIFNSVTEDYIQDILDLIEYANGDSVKTYWGAIRAANGHSEPYNLKYIVIKNSDAAIAIEDAISQKYGDDVTVLADDYNASIEYNYINIPLSAPESNIDAQTILLIAAPLAAVLAIAIIVTVLIKKRK